MVKLFTNYKLAEMSVLFLVLLIAVSSLGLGDIKASNYIQIRGSDTMVNLAQNLAENFMDEYDEYSVSVTGGGSGTGIAALINGQVDIANVSREMSEAEISQAEDNDVYPMNIAIAMDGLAVFTNESIELESLTVEQIGAIFRGDITNWSEVGGPDRAISLYGRQSNSGTFVYFRARVLQADYSDRMRRMNGTAQIVEAVKNDNTAIGYGGIGYTVEDGQAVSGLNILKIAVDEETEPASPLIPENVETGLYPIARPLFNYTDGKPEGAIRAYIDYVLSETGQDIAVHTGFYPVSPEYREFNERQLAE